MLLPNRCLDICGCSNVSDNGICTLSKSCHRLELLDLTSTGVGHKRLVISGLSLVDYRCELGKPDFSSVGPSLE